MKNLITALCWSLVVMLAGCSQAGNELAANLKKPFEGFIQNEVRRNIIVLLDVSRSTTEEQKSAYIHGVENIYRELTVNDRMSISTIDGGSYVNPVRVLNEDFLNAERADQLRFGEIYDTLSADELRKMAPPFYRVQEQLKVAARERQEARLELYRSNALPRLRKLLLETYRQRARYGKSSNLIWGLKNAEADLEQQSASARADIEIQNYVVLLSDMVNENDEVSFDRPLGIIRSEAEQLLLTLGNTGRLPSLNRARIICIGRAKTAVIRSEAGVQNIENFWRAYFNPQHSNGILVAYVGIDKIDQLKHWISNIDQ